MEKFGPKLIILNEILISKKLRICAAKSHIIK